MNETEIWYNHPHTFSSQDNESHRIDKGESSPLETSIHSADELEDVQQKPDVTITQTVLQKWLVVQLEYFTYQSNQHHSQIAQ
jgi:hypothetical protein